eukprot:5662515-Pyramimonas_sp.AAC.1
MWRLGFRKAGRGNQVGCVRVHAEFTCATQEVDLLARRGVTVLYTRLEQDLSPIRVVGVNLSRGWGDANAPDGGRSVIFLFFFLWFIGFDAMCHRVCTQDQAPTHTPPHVLRERAKTLVTCNRATVVAKPLF